MPSPPDPPLGTAVRISSRRGKEGGEGGETREPEAESTPDGRESGGKRDERLKANFIARPGAPH